MDIDNSEDSKDDYRLNTMDYINYYKEDKKSGENYKYVEEEGDDDDDDDDLEDVFALKPISPLNFSFNKKIVTKMTEKIESPKIEKKFNDKILGNIFFENKKDICQINRKSLIYFL